MLTKRTDLEKKTKQKQNGKNKTKQTKQLHGQSILDTYIQDLVSKVPNVVLVNVMLQKVRQASLRRLIRLL